FDQFFTPDAALKKLRSKKRLCNKPAKRGIGERRMPFSYEAGACTAGPYHPRNRFAPKRKI
ncbi:MAG: hypothetical protein KKE72_05115, partial [Gammaproteobacteria bacterium]|nr:hypothetical protein [Gammaproteobacteria bacterium]